MNASILAFSVPLFVIEPAMHHDSSDVYLFTIIILEIRVTSILGVSRKEKVNNLFVSPGTTATVDRIIDSNPTPVTSSALIAFVRCNCYKRSIASSDDI